MALARGVVVLVLSSITACGTASEAPPPPTTVAPPPPTTVAPPPVPEARIPYDAALNALPTATAIRVTEGWMGLTHIGPLAHHYELTLGQGGFLAHLVCHAGRQELAQPDQTIPVESVTPILARLTSAEVTPGPYQPRFQHTDDYPNLSMEIDSPAGTLAFTSRSQGDEANPWQIGIGSDAAVVESPLPGRALHALSLLVGMHRCREWVNTL